MVIKTYALFTTSGDETDEESNVHILLDETITRTEVSDDGGIKITTFIPTTFIFDMCDVTSINKSSHAGYSTIRYMNDNSFSIRMSFEKVERLFKLCHG